ncbi:MAG TPA: hypothetical protein VHO70_19375 [Chitinispirillaceae bacterium]|nr:hypothetical protein [Chitinispirillaceae bacterium]
MDIQILIAVGIPAIAFFAIIKWRAGARYGKIRPSTDDTEAYCALFKKQSLVHHGAGDFEESTFSISISVRNETVFN